MNPKVKNNPDRNAAYTQIQNIRKEIQNTDSDTRALLEMIRDVVKFCESRKLFDGVGGSTLETFIRLAYGELSERTGVPLSWRH